MERDRAGGAGGAVSRFAPPIFGRYVNFIPIGGVGGGADSDLLLIFAPSIFRNFRRQCSVEG